MRKYVYILIIVLLLTGKIYINTIIFKKPQVVETTKNVSESRWNPSVFISLKIPDRAFLIVRFNDSTYTWSYEGSLCPIEYKTFEDAEKEAIISYKLFSRSGE